MCSENTLAHGSLIYSIRSNKLEYTQMNLVS